MKKKKAAKKTKRVYNRWKRYLKQFCDGFLDEIVIHDWSIYGYTSRTSCYASLYKIVEHHRLPLRVVMEDGVIYIQKI